jgi:hypothetical protein
MTHHDARIPVIFAKLCDQCRFGAMAEMAYAHEAGGKSCALTDCILGISADVDDGLLT